jgi:hypothetical protein
VLIAALYCDFHLLTNIFGQVQMDPQMNTFDWLIHELYKHRDNFEGIHDRKMIIWLFCRLLSDGIVPNAFQNQANKVFYWIGIVQKILIANINFFKVDGLVADTV